MKDSAPGESAGPGWKPVGVLLACLGVTGLVRVATAWQLPMPFCALRKLTGIPCPACGSTRSLLAWTHLDAAAAFHFNPLFCIGFVLGTGWLLLCITDGWTGRGWASRIEGMVRKGPVLRVLVVLAILNWVYLCFSLPK